MTIMIEKNKYELLFSEKMYEEIRVDVIEEYIKLLSRKNNLTINLKELDNEDRDNSFNSLLWLSLKNNKLSKEDIFNIYNLDRNMYSDSLNDKRENIYKLIDLFNIIEKEEEKGINNIIDLKNIIRESPEIAIEIIQQCIYIPKIKKILNRRNFSLKYDFEYYLILLKKIYPELSDYCIMISGLVSEDDTLKDYIDRLMKYYKVLEEYE